MRMSSAAAAALLHTHHEALKVADEKSGAKGSKACLAYHREVTCARCHPFAAHIYDAEFANGFNRQTAKPGLAAQYCKDYYAACKARTCPIAHGAPRRGSRHA